jgi:hemolysin activation/secretion protein
MFLLFLAAAVHADPLPPVTQPADGGPVSSRLTIRVRRFEFQGNSVISTNDLRAALRGYLNRDLTIEDLEQARVEIGQIYIHQGYINSGAVLPDQDLANGVLLFKIVEGRLSEIRVNQTGPHRLRKDYLVDRVETAAGPPLNLNKLQSELELLRQDPNIARVNADLRPGLIAGSSSLDLNVAETNPIQAGAEFNNHRSPVVGPERFYLLGGDTDVTGNGDRFAFRYGVIEGDFHEMRLAGADDFSLDYAIPLTPYDTTIAINYTRSNDLVIAAPFKAAGISSRSESLTLTLRQPLYRTANTEFAVSIAGAMRSNLTSVFGQPFSFSFGSDNGESRVTALRIGQEFTRRNENDTLALRSTISIGLDALGSTVTRDGIGDSRFLAWLGQAQYVRRIGKSDSLLILRAAGQIADNALPSLEQFSIGGFDTVRGYRENRVVADNGVSATAEVQIPLLRKSERNIVTLAPFFDCGYAGDNSSPSATKSEFISSVGVGILLNPTPRVSLQLYYGFPFKHFDNSDPDIQDYGLHFDMLVTAF